MYMYVYIICIYIYIERERDIDTCVIFTGVGMNPIQSYQHKILGVGSSCVAPINVLRTPNLRHICCSLRARDRPGRTGPRCSATARRSLGVAARPNRSRPGGPAAGLRRPRRARRGPPSGGFK